MKVICKHCEKNCKKPGRVECAIYEPISERSSKWSEEIKKCVRSGKNSQIEAIQKKLDYFNYGI